MRQRPCLDCGRLHRNESRCDGCQAAYNVSRGSSTSRGYGSKWRVLRAAVLADWLAVHGAVCPGWRREPHEVEPSSLAVDHVQPKARGGTDERSNLSVLCTSCNSAKRDR
jgi:5-methylcytosine-specific restriction protein A